MGILDDIVHKWGSTPALQSLVPGGQVILGEPIAGWPVPAVAMQGYQRIKRARGSAHQADTLTLRCLITAETGASVEAIAEAMLAHLLPLSTGTRSITAWESYTLDLSRDPTSEQYTGSFVLTCHMWSTS